VNKSPDNSDGNENKKAITAILTLVLFPRVSSDPYPEPRDATVLLDWALGSVLL